jgi:hypothetical protein
MKLIKVYKVNDERYIYGFTGKLSFLLTKSFSNSRNLSILAYKKESLDVHILDLNDKPYFMEMIKCNPPDRKQLLSLDEVFLDQSRVILVRTNHSP